MRILGLALGGRFSDVKHFARWPGVLMDVEATARRC